MADPLIVTCPLCSSQPGNKCVNGNYREITGAHPERERLAKRVEEYKQTQAALRSK